MIKTFFLERIPHNAGHTLPFSTSSLYYRGCAAECCSLVNSDSISAGTSPFTVQTIDPYTGGPDCLSNAITGRCDFAVYLTAGAERYTLYNTDFLPITRALEIYRDNVFVTRQLHEVAPYSKRTFTMPTPSAVTGQAEVAEPRYSVNVKPVREATPTPEPTPTGRTSYVPLVWTRR